MTTVAVIPARYASTRFPGKPLAKQSGKFLVQHVCERVAEAESVARVVVATDDQRIVDAVHSYGGEAQLTRDDHPSGTDRVSEVISTLALNQTDLVLNVQGDEPDIDPRSLDRLVERMQTCSADVKIGTLAARFPADGPCDGVGSPQDPNCVKVVIGSDGFALYFSRSLIPYSRSTGGAVDDPSRWLLHQGVYAFQAGALAELSARGHSASDMLEEAECLEQLRWLSQGWRIAVELVDVPSIGIDTPEDYEGFLKRLGVDT